MRIQKVSQSGTAVHITGVLMYDVWTASAEDGKKRNKNTFGAHPTPYSERELAIVEDTSVIHLGEYGALMFSRPDYSTAQLAWPREHRSCFASY